MTGINVLMNIPLYRPSKPIKKKAQASTKLPPATTTNVKISEAASGSGQNRKSPEKPSKKNTLFDDISDDDEADIPFSKSRPKLNPVLETKKKEPTKKPTKGNKSGLIFEGHFSLFWSHPQRKYKIIIPQLFTVLCC